MGQEAGRLAQKAFLGNYSHLNEATFTAGNANSLMTPMLGAGEAIHDPGGIVRGMFNDMGFDAQILSPASIATVEPTWNVVGAGDYNGDGRADILWRHVTGTVILWVMNVTQISAGTVAAVDPAWELVYTR